MHFFGRSGISKICIFSRKMHIFQDPGLKKMHIHNFPKKSVYAFFWEVWNLKNMHFLEENAYFSGSRAEKKCIYTISTSKIEEIPHVFAAQTLAQKMHIHLVGFFGGPKNAYPHFWKIVDMHFLLALDPEKYAFSSRNCMFLRFQTSKKMHIHNFHWVG